MKTTLLSFCILLCLVAVTTVAQSESSTTPTTVDTPKTETTTLSAEEQAAQEAAKKRKAIFEKLNRKISFEVSSILKQVQGMTKEEKQPLAVAMGQMIGQQTMIRWRLAKLREAGASPEEKKELREQMRDIRHNFMTQAKGMLNDEQFSQLKAAMKEVLGGPGQGPGLGDKKKG